MKRFLCVCLVFVTFFFLMIPCSAHYYDDDGRFADGYEFDREETESAGQTPSLKEITCTILLSLLIIPLFLLLLHFLDR